MVLFIEGLMAVLLFTLIFTILFIRISHHLKLIDSPEERSFHVSLTPKGGGIVFTFVALSFIALTNWQLIVEYNYVFISILIMTFIGIIDDIFNCSPRVKFLAIFVAVFLLYYNGLSINSLGTYFGHEVALHWLLVFPMTFFAIAGFTNALNLIDGIDGLSTGISIIILATFLFIGLKFDDLLLVVLSSSFIFSLLGFLVLNWNPARIFMGDSGSLTLGFLIAVLAIKSLDYINPTAILFIASIPILDTFTVILRRKQRKLSIFKADKNHLHHTLFNRNGDVKFTAFLLWNMQLIFAIIGFRSIGHDDAWNIFLFLLLFILFLNLFDPRDRRRKNKRHKKRINKVYRTMYKWTSIDHKTKIK